MMNYLQKFFKLPFLTKLRFILYPIFMIREIPIAWFKSLWNARVLLNGQWDRYIGFDPTMSINNLYYKTQWININRHGIHNISPNLGLGNFDLKNWFYLSLPASFIYARAGAVTTLFGTVFWVFSHIIWMGTLNPFWVVLATIVLFFSTISYAMAFKLQNYQILGLMWYPLALFATIQGYLLPACFLWFAAAIFGITPIFFAIPIVSLISFMNSSYITLIVLVPATIWIATSFVPLIISGNLTISLKKIAKLIGTSKSKVKYNRGMKKYGTNNYYFTFLYVSCGLSIWFHTGTFPELVFSGVFFFINNQRFFRVADDRNLQLIVSTLFTVTIIIEEPSLFLFFLLIIVLNPIGLFIGIENYKIINKLKHYKINIKKPIDISNLKLEIINFLGIIEKGSKIIFGFKDPKNWYWNIFDGYRVIHELPLFIAAEKGVHLLPDWYAVIETNYEGAPEIWGVKPSEVLDNCKRWKADYAIIYSNEHENLDSSWNINFDVITQIDWKKMKERHFFIQNIPTPLKWHLLKVKKEIH